jgi:quercetin dioxygenase-like cupin family protein
MSTGRSTGTSTGTAPAGARDAVVLSAAAIQRLPLSDLHGVSDVKTRVLWSKGRSLAGILEIPAGRELGEHAHPEAHHHAWVLNGDAVILGVHVTAGSYVHIPAGMPHAVEQVGHDGLRMLYLFET